MEKRILEVWSKNLFSFWAVGQGLFYTGELVTYGQVKTILFGFTKGGREIDY